MSTTEKQHSRRDILKKSAAAGAVFWAVPVIDSVVSRAAAGSTVAFQCSYGIIVYMQTGTNNYFYARYSSGSTSGSGCANGANNGGNGGCTFSGTSNGLSVVINSWTGQTPDITVNGTALTSSNFSCANLTQTGDTITANSGYTMLAAVAFGGNQCASAAVTGSSVQFIGCI